VITVSRWRYVTLAAVLLSTFCGVAQAQAPATPVEPLPAPTAPTVPPGPVSSFLYADASQEGVISLFFDAPGSRVIYYERVGSALKRLGATQSAPGTQTVFREATTWSCSRLVRSFHAIAVLPDGRVAFGDYSVRTHSCDDRFDVSVPRRVAPGKVARVRVVDLWGIGGLRPKLCIRPPGGRRTCDTLAFPRAVAVASRRFRASKRGRWRVELRVRDHRERRSVQVGGGEAPAPPPIVLATGDSTMQGVDSFLSADLGETARVRSDVRPGFGVSKGNAWARLATTHVKQLHPATTVVSIGGAEGATMTAPDGASILCCDEPWVNEYGRRVRRMMKTYARRGRGRVLWLTQPTPSTAPLALVTNAVNAGIVRAAAGLKDVTVLRMDTLFTPNGYSETIRYRGRTVRVRQGDGVHLNVAGTAIAATAIAKVLRGRP
jgi:hypothetical protein